MNVPSILGEYEALFGNLTADITATIGKLGRSDDESKSKEYKEFIESSLEECEEMLEQVDLEILSVDSHEERNKRKTRFLPYITELKRIRQEYDQIKDRKSLFESDSSFGIHHSSSSVKDRLLDNTERLERSGRKIEMGHKILKETESTGAAVLNDLARQRETLQRSRNRLRDVDHDLGSSSRILSQMIQRIQSSRVLLVGIFIFLIFGLLLGVYISFSGR